MKRMIYALSTLLLAFMLINSAIEPANAATYSAAEAFSSGDYSATYPPSNVIDGNTGTYWYSSQIGTVSGTAFIGVKLAASSPVQDIDFFQGPSSTTGNISSVKVLGSTNGVDYQDVITASLINHTIIHLPKPVAYLYWKFVANSNVKAGYTWSMAEISFPYPADPNIESTFSCGDINTTPNSPVLAFDGVARTLWYSSQWGSSNPIKDHACIGAKLKQQYQMDSIDLTQGYSAGGNVTSVHVMGSNDGQTYTTVLSNVPVANQTTVTIPANSASYQYWKIVANSNTNTDGWTWAVDNIAFHGTAVQPAPLNAVYVDPVNGLDSNDGLTATTAVQTINHAVDVAKAGDTIYLKQGVYRETLSSKVYWSAPNKKFSNLVVDKSVTIKGENIDNTIILVDSANQSVVDTTQGNRYALTVSAPNVTFENLTLKLNATSPYYDFINIWGLDGANADNALFKNVVMDVKSTSNAVLYLNDNESVTNLQNVTIKAAGQLSDALIYWNYGAINFIKTLVDVPYAVFEHTGAINTVDHYTADADTHFSVTPDSFVDYSNDNLHLSTSGATQYPVSGAYN